MGKDIITVDETRAETKVAYVNHPITKAQKKAILGKYDKILDCRFNPEGRGIANVTFKKPKDDTKDDEPTQAEWDDLKARAENQDITVQANIKFSTLLAKVEAAEQA
jgi:hypothetical protein